MSNKDHQVTVHYIPIIDLIILLLSKRIVSVESRSSHDQNTSWIIVGYPGERIYSNKEFSQVLKFPIEVSN